MLIFILLLYGIFSIQYVNACHFFLYCYQNADHVLCNNLVMSPLCFCH